MSQWRFTMKLLTSNSEEINKIIPLKNGGVKREQESVFAYKPSLGIV